MSNRIFLSPLALMMAGALITPLALAEDNLPLLETVGVAELEVQPDMAWLEVQVVSKGPDGAYVKKASDKAVAGFISRLTALGVKKEDIESANLSLHPEYDYEKGREVQIKGFSASRQMTVAVRDLDKLNAILEQALGEGINSVNQIRFALSDDSGYRAKVRQLAIADAQAKAKSLATGFGEKLDGVWRIRYFEQVPVRPMLYKAAAMEADAVDRSYESSAITLSDRVEVSYRLKQ
ncbi:SIMPL domain-containing protein [Shewanella cyperi]|uniref:SIMPL domain-containing protein n=1 Tax=Shewanella cyperi TaxID=2814292 RepID=UPI001D192001|nr:SIMPL domain-containing protein [Shewanella cyperi]